MATHRRFVLNFYALKTIVLVLIPVCCMAQSSRTSITDNSDIISASSSGFGYEMLRSQLDEMQASIAQLQQTAERQNECAGLGANIATILNRLETIENGLKASDFPASSGGSTSFQRRTLDEDRRQRIIDNARRLSLQAQEMYRVHDIPTTRNAAQESVRGREIPTPRSESRQSIYDTVYDSCDDVPSSGVWRIRAGIQITNVYCTKF